MCMSNVTFKLFVITFFDNEVKEVCELKKNHCRVSSVDIINKIKEREQNFVNDVDYDEFVYNVSIDEMKTICSNDDMLSTGHKFLVDNDIDSVYGVDADESDTYVVVRYTS